MNINYRKELKKLFFIVVSAFIIALNIKSFVNAGELYPGGFNGLTLLIQRIASHFFQLSLPFSLTNYALNAVLIIISYKVIGKKFTFYTCLMIVLTGIFTDLIPARPITSDILLICIFGGIINGFGVGLCLMGNASGGGTDVIGILLSEKYHIDPWNYILAGNAVMLLVAGYLFGWNQALYSIIFQFSSTQVLHAMYLRYKRHTLFIITDLPEQVYEEIYRCTNHGATIFKGTGCYEKETRSMVYSVVSSDEVKQVTTRITEVDPKAFINAIKTDHLHGLFFQRPNE